MAVLFGLATALQGAAPIALKWAVDGLTDTDFGLTATAIVLYAAALAAARTVRAALSYGNGRIERRARRSLIVRVYWKNESNMADGSPTLLLERDVPVATPPALWIQASEDDVHNYRDCDSGFDGTEAERFVARYRKAGGQIELVRYEAPALFTTVMPDLPQSLEALKRIATFVHRTIPIPPRA